MKKLYIFIFITCLLPIQTFAIALKYSYTKDLGNGFLLKQDQYRIGISQGNKLLYETSNIRVGRSLACDARDNTRSLYELRNSSTYTSIGMDEIKLMEIISTKLSPLFNEKRNTEIENISILMNIQYRLLASRMVSRYCYESYYTGNPPKDLGNGWFMINYPAYEGDIPTQYFHKPTGKVFGNLSPSKTPYASQVELGKSGVYILGVSGLDNNTSVLLLDNEGNMITQYVGDGGKRIDSFKLLTGKIQLFLSSQKTVWEKDAWNIMQEKQKTVYEEKIIDIKH